MVFLKSPKIRLIFGADSAFSWQARGLFPCILRAVRFKGGFEGAWSPCPALPRRALLQVFLKLADFQNRAPSPVRALDGIFERPVFRLISRI
ncbi:MAG: hypothetical protein A2234_01825 [Elusimicrobia bacterium RIFOXYA2_FULL_58_8]|nr:MAG: hypothetical protein A2234_01825 [Elusimicrobia bacterium RIFOXYA2_FULL_58_8]OGS13401.1 MAG: hypothetical protein A2285_09095 [Elusimicrobia bacterium RIFOXYA12_FULL_57_11]